MCHQCLRHHERPLSHQSTASASPKMPPSSQVASPVPAPPSTSLEPSEHSLSVANKCFPRARMCHQCPRHHQRPLSHQSTASASPKMPPSSQDVSPVPAPPSTSLEPSGHSISVANKCFPRARLRHQCLRHHERPLSHQSTASASPTSASLEPGCVTSACATINVP